PREGGRCAAEAHGADRGEAGRGVMIAPAVIARSEATRQSSARAARQTKTAAIAATQAFRSTPAGAQLDCRASLAMTGNDFAPGREESFNWRASRALDCRVASLLAMTGGAGFAAHMTNSK